ncbi:MAG: hypothetical protein ABR522_13580 [Marinobacter sp.]
MKDVFRKVFWPILFFFEKGGSAEGYRPSHRKILLAVGFLFLLLSGVSLMAARVAESLGAVFPIVLFFVVSLVCFVVGLLGSNSAVARIWGNR